MKSPLRTAREQRGMTLQVLAGLVRSDVGNLSRIERGTQSPSRDLAERICAQFSGELDELQLIYPHRTPSERNQSGRQPPSPTNILDTIPAHSVVLPAIQPPLEPKEKP